MQENRYKKQHLGNVENRLLNKITTCQAKRSALFGHHFISLNKTFSSEIPSTICTYDNELCCRISILQTEKLATLLSGVYVNRGRTVCLYSRFCKPACMENGKYISHKKPERSLSQSPTCTFSAEDSMLLCWLDYKIWTAQPSDERPTVRVLAFEWFRSTEDKNHSSSKAKKKLSFTVESYPDNVSWFRWHHQQVYKTTRRYK